MATETAPVNPYLAGAELGIGTTTDIIGMILDYQSQTNAASEAKRLDARNYAEDKRRNAFSQRMQTEQLNLGKQAQALNENQFLESKFKTNLGISETAFNQMQKSLENNTALRNNVLKLWA